MAILSKAAFLSKWATKFADNSTRLITEEFMREFKDDISDSFFSLKDNYAFTSIIPALGTNAYTGTLPLLPATITYIGMWIFVKFQNDSTGDVTINISGIGVVDVFKDESTQAGSGDIIAGRIYLLVYDGTQFQIVGGVDTGGGGGTEHWRGAWDASGDVFPVDGDAWGSGVAGALQAGDEGYLSVGGNLESVGDGAPSLWNAYAIIKYIGSGNWIIKA